MTQPATKPSPTVNTMASSTASGPSSPTPSPVTTLAVTTQMSLDQAASEIALHVGATNYGYTLARDLRTNTLSMTIITK
jgi:hypothetical protein